VVTLVVDIKMYNTDNPQQIFEEKAQKELIIGEENMTQGLEKGLCSMKKGEVSQITVSPMYGFGESGFSRDGIQVPPNTNITYQIELVSFEKEKETWEMDSFSEKKDAALRRKNDGNKFYSSNKYQLAIRKYQRAIDLFSYKTGMKDSEKQESIKEIEVPCHGNISQCFLKEKNYKKALEHANKVIDLDKSNTKGLWRRGEAYLGLNEIENAEKDFAAAVQLEPNDKSLQSSLKKAQQMKHQVMAKEKNMWKKAFQTSDEKTHRNQEENAANEDG